MKQYNYELKKLVNKKGFYCDLSIEYELKSDVGVEISYKNPLDYNESYHSAIIFGLHYFYNKSLFKKNRQKLCIIINSISYNPVDTTDFVVFFTTVMLFCELFDQNIEGLSISEEGLFNIPK
ncbi:hypothetical protein FLBR109950_03765 [Flavobacterium branchiophilum]|uniref:Uncharacterized protein n=1 Tax=Flavobacterium branchiophilum (strain FL-15) TaxID=1034807 RepID=G2Z426_FLABF|nr:hypothetical protein [Flavobacterium branchiophilum]CCB68365.1 Hypothetical protein FBFL15_0218 [Flavobacterium branchiophilum FL-15]